MTALARDIVIPSRLTEHARAEFAYYVQAGARVFRGSILVLCSDETVIPAGAAPGGGATVAGFAGLADHYQDNTGTTGVPSGLSQPRRVRARRGCFAVAFDTPPAATNLHATVYALDDATVTLTPTGHPAVGALIGFDEHGLPWVETL